MAWVGEMCSVDETRWDVLIPEEERERGDAMICFFCSFLPSHLNYIGARLLNYIDWGNGGGEVDGVYALGFYYCKCGKRVSAWVF